jgi:CRP/FNR family transcriptional regulator, cyclic AMP receptor protein
MQAENYTETMMTRVSLHPFLAGLSATHQALLADCAVSVRFHKGEIILREGERADRFFLLETGQVTLESERAEDKLLLVDTIGAGDLLGCSWMFPPYTWQFTARATAPTRALLFIGSILRDYCEHDHSLGYQLLKRMTAVMVRRLQKARRQMLSIQVGEGLLQAAPLQVHASHSCNGHNGVRYQAI